MQHIIDSLPTFSYNNDTHLNSVVASLEDNIGIIINNQDDTIFYNLVGNFVPPEWRNLTGSRGKQLSKTARQLLSLIVSCFVSVDSSDSDSDELQEGYYFFERKLGLCQRRVRQCLLELEQGNFIKVDLRTIVKNYTRCRNILCIKLIKNFQAYSQKVSAEPEQNFGYERNNFQPLHIIDNNISISKSRYNKIVDNFVDNSETNNQLQNEQEIISVNTSLADKDHKDASNKSPSTPNTWINNITDKAKKWCIGKKLEEFHPLTEEDGTILRTRSNRDFGLEYINKLLLKLAKQYPDHRFYSKKLLLSYMTKALIYELRQTTLVNNANFNFSSKIDCEVKAKEQYLQQVESSMNTDRRSQLRKKVTGIFDRDTSYGLLTSCSFVGVVGNQYRLELIKQIDLSEHIKMRLLKEVQAVYSNDVQQLQITSSRPITPISSNSDTSNYLEQLLEQLTPDSIWYKVRQYLVKYYDQHIDKAWFSKLEVIEEDNNNKKVILKAKTTFIGDWIKQNYDIVLSKAFQAQDFTYELVKA